jgi:hypothetical protein
MGHGGELAAGRNVAAEASPAQIASQPKVVHATVLKLGRQANHVGPRGKHLFDHQGTFLGALEWHNGGAVSRGFGCRGDHAHAKVLLIVSTNEYETHMKLLCSVRVFRSRTWGSIIVPLVRDWPSGGHHLMTYRVPGVTGPTPC